MGSPGQVEREIDVSAATKRAFGPAAHEPAHGASGANAQQSHAGAASHEHAKAMSLLGEVGTVTVIAREGMFVRRVIVLASIVLLGLVVLGLQLSRLTLGQGAAHREAAETRLVREAMLPMSRGSIVDAKGRMLAHDRSSLDVGVDYAVLSGRWAREQARLWTRRQNSSVWRSLSEAERVALVEPALRAIEDHVRWSMIELSQRLGMPAEQMEREQARIVERVEQIRQRYIERKNAEDVALATTDGRTLSQQALEQIQRKNAQMRVEEEQIAHTLGSRVADAVGFDLLRVGGETTELRVPGSDGQDRRISLPRFPGLRVAESHDREYPLETMTVTIDRSTLPKPVRSSEPITLTIRGVDTLVVGRTRGKVFATDVQARRVALEQDPALRRRAVSPFGVSAVLEGMGAVVERDLGAYATDDSVGSAGLEAGLERELRGRRGVIVRRVDNGMTRELAPVRGRDVRLSIDMELQARILGVLQPETGLCVVQKWQHPREAEADLPRPIGTPLGAAAVVLDVASGKLLALASSPTVTRADIALRGSELVRDEVGLPMVHRAFQKVYAAGSIVKPLIYVGAVTQGTSALGERIACTGHLFESNPDAYRCWIYKSTQRGSWGVTHSDSGQFGGPLSVEEALMVSCNIYFYTLGRRLGAEGMIELFSRFGIGAGMPIGLGIGDEFVPSVGFRADGQERIDRIDATFMGIGQGPIQWTPVHAADAFATLARRGVRIRPSVLADEPPQRIETGLSPEACDAALRGLALAVSDERGTGHWVERPEAVFNVPGLRVWGKTGTADAAPVRVGPDPDGDGPLQAPIAKLGDHAWYVVLAGEERGEATRPRYAIAVVVDHGGSGGRVAGPVVNQILHTLADLGYLRPGQTRQAWGSVEGSGP